MPELNLLTATDESSKRLVCPGPEANRMKTSKTVAGLIGPTLGSDNSIKRWRASISALQQRTVLSGGVGRFSSVWLGWLHFGRSATSRYRLR